MGNKIFFITGPPMPENTQSLKCEKLTTVLILKRKEHEKIYDPDIAQKLNIRFHKAYETFCDEIEEYINHSHLLEGLSRLKSRRIIRYWKIMQTKTIPTLGGISIR